MVARCSAGLLSALLHDWQLLHCVQALNLVVSDYVSRYHLRDFEDVDFDFATYASLHVDLWRNEPHAQLMRSQFDAVRKFLTIGATGHIDCGMCAVSVACLPALIRCIHACTSLLHRIQNTTPTIQNALPLTSALEQVRYLLSDCAVTRRGTTAAACVAWRSRATVHLSPPDCLTFQWMDTAFVDIAHTPEFHTRVSLTDVAWNSA